jgi:hypothetical protein
MFTNKDTEFLAREKGVDTTDITMQLYFNEDKELMDICVQVAKEERGLRSANDIRFNPERLDMAESVLAEFLRQL